MPSAVCNSNIHVLPQKLKSIIKRTSATALTLRFLCSKLTMSLVNVPLEFQMLVYDICQYFLLKKNESAKASLTFSIKNINVIDNTVVKYLMS